MFFHLLHPDCQLVETLDHLSDKQKNHHDYAHVTLHDVVSNPCGGSLGSAEGLALLVQHQADVNAVNAQQVSALGHAALHRCPRLVASLLASRADPHICFPPDQVHGDSSREQELGDRGLSLLATFSQAVQSSHYAVSECCA